MRRNEWQGPLSDAPPHVVYFFLGASYAVKSLNVINADDKTLRLGRMKRLKVELEDCAEDLEVFVAAKLGRQ